MSSTRAASTRALATQDASFKIPLEINSVKFGEL